MNPLHDGTLESQPAACAPGPVVAAVEIAWAPIVEFADRNPLPGIRFFREFAGIGGIADDGTFRLRFTAVPTTLSIGACNVPKRCDPPIQPLSAT